nr:unnamed protein product [Callosobruchus analis]
MPISLHANIGQASNSSVEPLNISVADYSSPSTSQQTYDVNVDPEIIVDDGCHENDLGRYVGLATQLSTEKKRELLQNPWIPPRNYDFESDASHLKRKFNHAWLDQYSPWLVYSKRLKGALCKYCVLFPPPISTVRGILGSFMVRPYLKFKNMHEDCRKHATTNLHQTATNAAKNFLENVPVDIQLQSGHQKAIDENRQILSSIISCIVFCGTHDMPLRGKQADEGVLLDLLKLRIDSGDNKLKSHFEKCRRNAIYTSPRIQNELINLCGEVIQENVISEVRKTMAYSILADETADVSGKEQLSIGVRFYDESKSKIREEFVGFVELKAQNASAIAEAIDNFLISSNLSKEDCVGFGFDGCSTMAGKEGGVQAILRKKYPRALYFHCSSHKLNLVVNDANAVPEIRNTVATVKDVITFFRESTTRRNYAPNLSRLCETRWSEKYKSIRKFSQHFSELVKSLETLSVEGNYATRKSAYQLHSAVTKPVFIVSLQTIAKYSAVIEPVVNALQAKSIDMISVGKHIRNIKDILRNDREFPDRISNEILQKARAVAMDLNIEISVPRLAHKQTHRSNPPSDNDNEYWRRSLIIPYIDSLISSLNIRFSQENTPAFALSRLHPFYMTKTSIADLHKNAESFQEFYNLDITGELNLWHNLWVTKALSDDQLKDIEVVDLFKEANIFYPAVRKALIILSTIPCTTATVERSFSTLRRVKTWLRSTMGEERLTGLCLMSVHRNYLKDNSEFIEKIVIDKFSANPRRYIILYIIHNV